ncbi:MAG TPA: N-acetyltransferase [Dermatophilaceae bacterium]|nr:N-acetyltransferase [Dermatophilaceae bacterium]
MKARPAAWTPSRHPLARLLREVAAGTVPPCDGRWVRVVPWAQHIQGVVAFADHTVLAVSYDVTDQRLEELGVTGATAAANARVPVALAGPTGWVGTLDVLLVGAGTGAEGRTSTGLVSRHDQSRHPLVQHAQRTTQEVQVLGPPDQQTHDVVVMARGIAGIREIGVALDVSNRGRGLAASMVTEILSCVPKDELVLGRVPAANAAALQAGMRAGMDPIGSVQLFSRRPVGRT